MPVAIRHPLRDFNFDLIGRPHRLRQHSQLAGGHLDPLRHGAHHPLVVASIARRPIQKVNSSLASRRAAAVRARAMAILAAAMLAVASLSAAVVVMFTL
jgi:hypothetical protein